MAFWLQCLHGLTNGITSRLYFYLTIKPLIAANHNINILFQHVPGHRNKLADLLPRQRVQEYLQLQPQVCRTPSTNLESLLPTMNQLFRQGIAPSTCHLYKGGFNHYRHFCLMSIQQLFHVSEAKLLYLVTHLSRTLAYGKIKSYLCGIQFGRHKQGLIQADLNIGIPLLGTSNLGTSNFFFFFFFFFFILV